MEFEDILYTKQQGVAVITLNRPQAMNAFTRRVVDEWAQAIEDAKQDPEVGAIVITGAGRVFCSGANPRALDATGGAFHRDAEDFTVDKVTRTAVRTLANLDKPYIAAINGGAAGGGMDIASMCDIRIASERARFSMAYIRMGVCPALGGAYFLPRLVGLSRACELIWTGRTFDAQEAMGMGYVSRVVPHDELMPATLELAQTLARGPAVAIRMSKRLIYRCLQLDLDAAFEAHSMSMLLVEGTEDAQEGPRAWVEKREPQFKGR